jgi:hypothetical protein
VQGAKSNVHAHGRRPAAPPLRLQARLRRPGIKAANPRRGPLTPAGTPGVRVGAADQRVASEGAEHYTSGTASAPKDVVHCHRGMHLPGDRGLGRGVGGVAVPVDAAHLPRQRVWSYTWGMAMVGGVNVCLHRDLRLRRAPRRDAPLRRARRAHHAGQLARAFPREEEEEGAHPHGRDGGVVHVEARVGRAALVGARAAQGVRTAEVDAGTGRSVRLHRGRGRAPRRVRHARLGYLHDAEVPGPRAALHGAQGGGLPRRSAQVVHRQGPEVRAPGTGQGHGARRQEKQQQDVVGCPVGWMPTGYSASTSGASL